MNTRRVQRQEILVESWSDFEGQIRRLTMPVVNQPETTPRSRPWLFRGLGNSCWGLETTLERSYPNERCDETLSLQKYYKKILAAKPAVETFSGRRWELPNPPEFAKIIKNHWTR